MDSVNSVRQFGVSVRGPRHKRRNEPSQDAWLGARTRFGSFIVVCDGLGSRKQSHIGAAAACTAVKLALHCWCSSSDVRIENLIRLVRLIWEVQVAPITLPDAATTCLFAAFLSQQRRLIVAGLGDGLALVRCPGNSLQRVIRRTDGFGNQTFALGVPHALGDWQHASFDDITQPMAVLLATDGIADDLTPEREGDFLDWLIQTFGSQPSRQRYHVLRRELENWPVPKHQDDKTLAVLYAGL